MGSSGQRSEFDTTISLQPENRKSPIHHDDLSGGVGEVAGGQGCDGFADIFGISPVRGDGESVGDQFVVFFGDPRGHIGGSHAGADFVNRNAEFSQTCRPQADCHTQSTETAA
jgi:hypothetical protein